MIDNKHHGAARIFAKVGFLSGLLSESLSCFISKRKMHGTDDNMTKDGGRGVAGAPLPVRDGEVMRPTVQCSLENYSHSGPIPMTSHELKHNRIKKSLLIKK